MNISLLCKWWWRLDTESGLWQDIIRAKYLRDGLVNTVKPKLNDSPIWKDLLKVRHIYLNGRKMKPGDGTKTLFWTDGWLGDTPLCSMLSTLFELCMKRNNHPQSLAGQEWPTQFQKMVA